MQYKGGDEQTVRLRAQYAVEPFETALARRAAQSALGTAVQIERRPGPRHARLPAIMAAVGDVMQALTAVEEASLVAAHTATDRSADAARILEAARRLQEATSVLADYAVQRLDRAIAAVYAVNDEQAAAAADRLAIDVSAMVIG
jgi:hypothetical protein